MCAWVRAWGLVRTLLRVHVCVVRARGVTVARLFAGGAFVHGSAGGVCFLRLTQQPLGEVGRGCLCPVSDVTAAWGVGQVTIEGQSFMLHQIRHMIGAALSVALGAVPLQYIEASLCWAARTYHPLAPASVQSPWRIGGIPLSVPLVLREGGKGTEGRTEGKPGSRVLGGLGPCGQRGKGGGGGR